jgi:serine/threonine protein kinase
MNAAHGSTAWRTLEGRLVNGELPLLRCVSSSDRSAVFRTESAKYSSTTPALKLVRVDAASEEAQLSKLRAASELSHPHLIRIFEVGRCELDGLSYVYALMEYADQSLAQPLGQRTLSEQEVREMLPPILSALSYVHERNLVVGQLKPSNILAVGDDLKLASDTVLPTGKHPGSAEADSAYAAPETREGHFSPAGDLWSLGTTLCQALTGRLPSRSEENSGAVELPTEVPESFRDIIARCLKPDPKDRPSVADLSDWLGGASIKEEKKETEEAGAATLRLKIRAEIIPEDAHHRATALDSNRRMLLLAIGVLVAAALVWFAVRAFKGDPENPGEVSEPAVITEPQEASEPRETNAPPPQPAVPAAPAVATAPPPASATRAAEPPSPRASLSPVNEVVPNPPQSALNTITGTIRIAIRVTVAPDGSVVSTVSEVPGPSRYFERLSREAASKWTFTSAETTDQRTALLHFSLTRSGVTARAETGR